MKKIIALILCFVIVMSTVGCGNKNDPSASTLNPQFQNVEEFKTYVKNEKTELKNKTGESTDVHDINNLQYYYVYPNIPKNATIIRVSFSDKHVSIVYDIGLKKAENEIEERYYVTLKWERMADGQEWLDNAIKQNPIEQYENRENTYYWDTTTTNETLGRAFYFLDSGYMFYLYLPISLYNNLVESNINIFEVQKIILE